MRTWAGASPATARISTVEFDDILDEMKRDKEPLPPNHPLARGLRRGLGIYIEDVGMTVSSARSFGPFLGLLVGEVKCSEEGGPGTVGAW